VAPTVLELLALPVPEEISELVLKKLALGATA
jgi:hypothetical protein